ncbi:MAG: hypothetical protein HC881_06940, partial [Leptolyngbyaceae cyanobacterium SL_7_1]|nr:hypothetical protein [Leptolyngbyaceae cyanobacterium SL_7_1]
MSTPLSTYSYRDFEADSERLYAHFLNFRTVETPDELLDRFDDLFIRGTDYPDLRLKAALDRIVSSRWADQAFGNIINRCCYILINYWWLQRDGWIDSGLQWATVELVNRLSLAANQPPTSPATRRLRELLTNFIKAEQYVALERRARAAENASDGTDDLIGNLINRYPYLYPYCLLDWDSTEIGQQAVKQQQQRREQQFEHDLFKYINALRRGKSSSPGAMLDVANPTLLEAEELQAAVRQFSGKAEGARTYKESAQQFLLEVRHAPAQQVMKKQLSHYLSSAISYSNNPKYGSHHFNQWLDEQLDKILPQQDHVRTNPPLLMQTCSQLLECLVASPKQPDNHFMFIDLIGNLGATFTVG